MNVKNYFQRALPKISIFLLACIILSSLYLLSLRDKETNQSPDSLLEQTQIKTSAHPESFFDRQYEVFIPQPSKKGDTSYRQTEWWLNYKIKRLENETYHQGIINELHYCKKLNQTRNEGKVKFLIDKKGLPAYHQKVILTDYIDCEFTQDHNCLIYEVIEQCCINAAPNTPRVVKSNLQAKYLRSDILVFMVRKHDFHSFHYLDKHFGCVGQRYNHIPNSKQLREKNWTMPLVLEYYERYYYNRLECFDPEDFTPFAYYLSNKKECESWFRQVEINSTKLNWIMKQLGKSRGIGVSVLDQETLQKLWNFYEGGEKCGDKNKQKQYIIQRYISNPLLIGKRKFDFRVYLIVANMDPMLALYHDGILRLSMSEFDINSTEKSVHLTNQQMMHDALTNEEQELNYVEEINIRESTVMTMSQFKQYLLENGYQVDIDDIRKAIKKSLLHLTLMFRER